MLISAEQSQLLIVDFQAVFIPTLFEGEQALTHAVKLAKMAQLLQIPITATAQNPEKLGGLAPDLQPFCGEVLGKLHFDACAQGLVDRLIETGTPQTSPNARSLPKHLQKPVQNMRTSIVVMGIEAHACVLQTVLSLQEEELEVWVVTDATTSRKERDKDAALDRLAGEGVNLVTWEMVVFEWLRKSNHAHFKAFQALMNK